MPAVEVMIPNAAVRNLIREGKTHQMPNVIQTGAQEGMQSLEQSLRDLYQRQLIGYDDASAAANDTEALKALIKRG